MGNLERNSETWKNPGFSGFVCRVSGIGGVAKRSGFYPGFWFFGFKDPSLVRTLFQILSCKQNLKPNQNCQLPSIGKIGKSILKM